MALLMVSDKVLHDYVLLMPRKLQSFGVDLAELPQGTSQKVPTPNTIPISSSHTLVALR